jgi:glycosyltransferase 2 family protein
LTAVASQDVPRGQHRLARRLRAAVLGPRGGGTTRRRASDAFRVAIAIAVVAVSIPVMRANSAVELSIVHALTPPPTAIRWLVTSVFWLGSAGVIVLLVIVGLLVPRLAAVRWTALAAVLTWGVCALLGALLGSDAGRPPIDALAGLNTGYPVTQLAVTIAVVATALPYLSRPVHRLVSFLVAVAALAAVSGGYALPVNAVSSLVLGWGLAAALHLAVGSPLGLPSTAEVTAWVADLNLTVKDITRSPRQVWGVEQLTGQDQAGGTIELAVYGRDASDARMLAKLWRFCLYRDSGPTLILDRMQQVEHEAYLTLMAGRAGVLVPEVLAAGRFGPSNDAALVTRLPDGPSLSQAAGVTVADGPAPDRPDADRTVTDRTVGDRTVTDGPVADRTVADGTLADSPVADATLDELLLTVLRLRAAGIAHGALGSDTLILAAEGICVRNFRCASSPAPASRLDSDLAAVLAAMAVRAGVERTAAAAARVLDADLAHSALVHLQRAALDPATVAVLQHQKDLLPKLRTAVASETGIDVPKLAEEKRISWTNLLFAVGSLIGVWAIIGVLSDASGSLDVIKGASWGWVALAFLFAQLPVVSEAWALIGAVVGQLPFGRCVALETSNTFTSLVGGNVAVFALRVRFFQRQGYDAEAAVSSGAIVSTASWVAESLLFLAAIGFAAGDFHVPSDSGGNQGIVWIVIAVILAVGIALALIGLVPRLRRMASRQIRPHLLTIWANIKEIATEPRKIFYVLAGSTLAQLLVILALGASLHAVGERASIATLITVNTLAAIIGGAVPVPGGAGVVEAGLIAGLTSAGIPQEQAVAAVFIQRLFTAYLPPIWGWVTLAWMRRREYI